MKQDLNLVITDLVNLSEKRVENLLDLDDEIILDLIKCYLRPILKERRPVKIDFYPNSLAYK